MGFLSLTQEDCIEEVEELKDLDGRLKLAYLVKSILFGITVTLALVGSWILFVNAVGCDLAVDGRRGGY